MKKIQNKKAESQQILSCPKHICIFKLYGPFRARADKDLSCLLQLSKEIQVLKHLKPISFSLILWCLPSSKYVWICCLGNRIISPLHGSACASPAWCCNIIALQSCWPLQSLCTLASQSKLDFYSHRGTHMSFMKGKKTKAGWSVFRVFLPFPAQFLCKQWLGGGLKRKAKTKGNQSLSWRWVPELLR